MRQRVVMDKLWRRLSQELWSLGTLVIRLPEGRRLRMCRHFSTVKGWQLKRTTASVSVELGGIGIVLGRKSGRRQIASARVLALFPAAYEWSECDVER
jgi:hypothetical protein